MKEIIVALVTPFDREGNIEYSVLDEIIDHNLKEGADGFFVAGSSGEGILLTFEEKVSVFRYLSKYADKTKLIANISSPGTKEAISLAEEVLELGYFAVSSVIPYYYKHSMESVVKYFKTIIESTDIPLIIYNFPQNSGINFNLDLQIVKDLFNHPKIIGLKHTNRDLYELERIMRINPKLKFYCGYDELYLSALVLGVDGAIGSTFNVTTKIFKKIGDLYEVGEIEEALKMQKKANVMMDTFIKVGLIPGIKHALSVLNIGSSIVRLPFIELNEKNKQELENGFKEFLKN